jgi:RHS repeat-associated protein
VSGNAGITTYAYDNAFRLTTITTSYNGSNGPQVVFGFDSGGRMTSESRTIGGSGTAVATSLSYDNADRSTTITHQVTGGAALATYVYGYDNANRVTTEQNAEGTVTYGYDATNELTGAAGSRAETYTYDLAGNRNMTGYTTGSDNELTASPGHAYTYDAEGNMITDTSGGVVTTYSYDYRNELTGVKVGGTTVATYTYDALGRRIGFDDSGTQTWVVWDGQNTYADFNGSGTLLERYLNGNAVDEILARTSSGGTTAWYLTDRLGTVRDIANTSGTVIDHLSYDSYGNVLTESSPANGDRYKFAGMQHDAMTGQSFDISRYYSPLVGRFLSLDPLLSLSDDNNYYRYCHNGPTNSVDPSGLYGLGSKDNLGSMTDQEYYAYRTFLSYTTQWYMKDTLDWSKKMSYGYGSTLLPHELAKFSAQEADAENAFLHAIGQMLATCRSGSEQAALAGDIHEYEEMKYNKSFNKNDSIVDQFNNRAAREIAENIMLTDRYKNGNWNDAKQYIYEVANRSILEGKFILNKDTDSRFAEAKALWQQRLESYNMMKQRYVESCTRWSNYRWNPVPSGF